MATRGKVSTSKVGKGILDSKQRKLSTEEVGSNKKVTFKEGDNEMEKEVKDNIRKEVKELGKEMINKVDEEIKKQMCKEKKRMEEEWKAYIEYIEKRWESKVSSLELKLEEVNKELKECKERLDRRENAEDRREEDEDGDTQSDKRSEYTYSRKGSSVAGRESVYSEDRFSVREVNKIKKLVANKEKEERKCNIAVKGLFIVDDMSQNKLSVERLIREKLGIECRIISCRRSGTVLVVKVESEEEKKQIMKNKYKLKGEKIYIENDLSWEERKIQERMNRWAKEQREKGKEIKIGYGRDGESRGDVEKLDRGKIQRRAREGEDRKGKRKRKRKRGRRRDIERKGTKFRISQEGDDERGTRLGLKRKEITKGRKLMFWNIAGVYNKDREFWKFIGEHDLISLNETWLNEKGWNMIKNKLPKSHEWDCSFATKENEKRKGRAKGGFIIGKRKGWGVSSKLKLQRKV